MIELLRKRLVKNWFLYAKQDRIGYAKQLGVHIGEGCRLYVDPDRAFGTEPWLVSLGNHVEVTAGVQFLTHEGGVWCAREIDKKYQKLDKFAPIKVGNNVMIGIQSIIMPGVTIGNNVIVGSNSVVTKDISDGIIVAGSPAKPISTIEVFLEQLTNDSNNRVVETKNMTQAEKKKYLEKIHPEWFVSNDAK